MSSTLNTLVNYSSDSDSDAEPSSPVSNKKQKTSHDQTTDTPILTADSAPATALSSTTSTTSVALYNLLPSTATQLTHNVPYAALALPVVGPENPLAASQALQRGQVGTATDFAMSEAEFRNQMRRFNDAQIKQVAQQVTRTAGSGIEYIDDDGGAHLKAIKAKDKRKRKAAGDVSVVEGDGAYEGPWAGYASDDGDAFWDSAAKEALMLQEMGEDAGAADDGQGVVDWTLEANDPLLSSNPKSRLITPGAERSVFHGKSERDYLGRSYMWPPTIEGVDLNPNADPPSTFLPKRCIHTYKGHTKGVNAIRLLPGTGHLLLSASMDNKVKLWDVYNDRRVLRTFLGHNKAVRDVTFNNDGRQFISASFDKYCKLWDTETGQCVATFTSGAVPLCVKFNPDVDKQHVFLAGQQDKKIVQYDTRSGEVIQEYNEHLGAVNSITFVDHNRRFVTTSDDKSLRAWEYDIPVVIKYIAEPHMHSMPAVSKSPNDKWLACQSLDNQILIYSATDKFRANRKKNFRGHLVAGYGCQVNFSPDCQYLMSGDSTGSMFFWDFKSCKLVKKFKAHDKVVMGCEWHPHETSKVFTCSWDGTIKLWD
ncbi:WD40-repeat-containing domain protein [Catenaria anguillulae PL171]|uniref:Pre-mRNA-processing factor 17 n=1 Tax=Catenaria anguillulae PL171 TaxID=765915 RepID=A0A1Y2HZR0_9FUNG|nr:WD40-repeat-containing domain protein [Catenaria anguillulae PL171]